MTSEGKIIKQGYLVKKGAKRKNWTTRWFVLRGKQLEYYKDPMDLKPRGTIPLENCTVDSFSGKANSFQVELKTRTFLITAGNATLRDQWIEAIRECSNVDCNN